MDSKNSDNIAKRGWASMTPEKRRAYGSQGGKAKVKKGLASLSPERRKEISEMGLRAQKRFQEKEDDDGGN